MLKMAEGFWKGREISLAENDSSPISGATILGDRIRMSQYYLDEGAFRSISN